MPRNGALACQERAANVTQRLPEHHAGVLANALAAAERTQVDKEHDNGNSDALLSPVSGVSSVLMHKFGGAHLFAVQQGALVRSSNHAARSGTNVQLEERVQAEEQDVSDVAAEVERVWTYAGVEAGGWEAEWARFEEEEKRWAQIADGIENEGS